MKREWLFSLAVALLLNLALLTPRLPMLGALAMLLVLILVLSFGGRMRFDLPVVLTLILAALAASWLAPTESGLQNSGMAPRLLGLDSLGRDLYSRLIIANRNSVLAAGLGGLLACGLAVVIGGLLARASDLGARLGNSLIQAFLSIPVLVYYLLALAVFDPGPWLLILLFGATLWAEPARLLQAKIRELREAEFVQVARMRGRGERDIFLNEILPNLGPLLMANLLVTVMNAVLLESILGYLGLGRAVGEPSLGRLIEYGTMHLDRQPLVLVVTMAVLMGWLAGLRGLMKRFARGNTPLRAQ